MLQPPVETAVLDVHVPIISSVDDTPDGNDPALSMIYSCVAVKSASTSAVLRASRAFARRVAGFNATKTVTAKATITAMTSKSSMRVKPR